ncbi:MAG TPA: GNAT family N-acetyltransferase [Marmoricola sp.]|nr:GNAT family N-acetyltransferase [Marmoricola sp.]
MSLPDVVTTPRFRLPLITVAEAADMRAGRRDLHWHADYPREDDLDAIGMLREPTPWGPRHIVRIFDGVTFGSVGFFGPPEEFNDVPEVEVGYGLVEEARRRGVMSEVLTAVLAHTDQRGVRVRASVEPENAASLRLLAKVGFSQLRGSDEDGNLVMARPLP